MDKSTDGTMGRLSRHADEGRHPRLLVRIPKKGVDGGPSPAMTGWAWSVPRLMQLLLGVALAGGMVVSLVEFGGTLLAPPDSSNQIALARSGQNWPATGRDCPADRRQTDRWRPSGRR